eukprot:CAMPEP_0172555770 /NCGR_PEP_ID=MMETSP1067-20121228/60064_1 /TAXON_ID=265564 ORGANISM="Thalassiosira punctigera, Strain Tpunct2005C2" /NCGR_SAMPLE_ID=MMETSP1067 /ASSEMBLY_ACC=CAM_ASM_000444 /LENGTH=336 /DNA_ID=CAMNT_0013344363 /DNA_START=17 /DNA_END=1027 /DNA_ORIENTATION=+
MAMVVSYADNMQKDPAAKESDGDEADDDELLMAAAAWVSAQNKDSDNDNDSDVAPVTTTKKKKSIKSKGDAGSTEHVKSSSSTKAQTANPHNVAAQSFSLHLTKVPYKASQGDIRYAFGEKGCNVTSVRLVYDRDQKTGERHFRGVAFVDLADEMSFKRGLEFHNKAFLGKGRRVNVRPTRTKSELSEIVRRTEEKVANLIARSKESSQTKKRHRDDEGANAQDKDNGGDRSKRRKKKKKKGKSSDADGANDKNDAHASKSKSNDGSEERKEAPDNKSRKKDKAEADGEPNSGRAKSKQGKGGAKSSGGGGTPVKLTKKQRAKKAAVIRMMKLKGK